MRGMLVYLPHLTIAAIIFVVAVYFIYRKP
jgi:hypothetical protein